MKKRKQIEALEEMIMDLASWINVQQGRIDELAARVARLEQRLAAKEIPEDWWFDDSEVCAVVRRVRRARVSDVGPLDMEANVIDDDADDGQIEEMKAQEWREARRANTHTTATPCPVCGQDRTFVVRLGYHDVDGFYEDDEAEET